MKRDEDELVTLGSEIGAPLADLRFAWGPVRLDFWHVADQESLWTEAIDLDLPPYWATVWPAALGLARWLIEQPAPPPETLELGCGIGLTGIVAAHLGAPVTQTDASPLSLRLSLANAERNALPAAGLRYWLTDWRRWPLRSRFPRVVGADILYEKSLHPALAEVLEASLAPGGEALLADPGRPPALDFVADLEARGWRVSLEELPRTAGEPNLWLYRCTRE